MDNINPLQIRVDCFKNWSTYLIFFIRIAYRLDSQLLKQTKQSNEFRTIFNNTISPRCSLANPDILTADKIGDKGHIDELKRKENEVMHILKFICVLYI